MSQGIHLISNSIPGYGRSEGRCLLCSRTSGVAGVPLYSHRVDCNSYPPIKIALLESPVNVSKRTSLVCSANSNNHRRNPDFSRQNRQNHSFSRNKNRPNMEREKSEQYEESEYLSSKNGPLLSLSNSPRYQATATPGPREKEIVELFRKVQLQLRARAAIKEEKKMDTTQGQGRETETVDSLLKLLRKHSVDQGKRRNGSSTGDFGDQPGQNNSFDEEHNTNFFESNTRAKEEPQETNMNPFRRPASNFQRRSPVPRVKYQPVYSVEGNCASDSPLNSQATRKNAVDESEALPESELKPEPEIEHQPDTDTETDPDLDPYVASSDVHDDEEFDVMSESDSDSEVEFSDTDEAFDDKVVEMPSLKQHADLSALKLPELRAIAKSRGVKGVYKLKKAELVGLLSDDSV
ncbi:rho-N domain-containing protein 1 protein [Thalictrum thalictroides]|uniref:Rho-N domain-containing protein 1 protein n=1 Tax=Thalictrum thalictroides TaxID=46969 RepID=A0A7J6WCU4_THATH|nr:rho-N domain-containing protein 1 protein [Thalictrum thalictroides]